MKPSHHNGLFAQPSAEACALLEIAELLDQVCETRNAAGASDKNSELILRQQLFALLDAPDQKVWELVRELAIYPSRFPGLDTPSPLGVTFGDMTYGFGLGDVACPSREQLMEVLRWSVTEYGDPVLGGGIHV